MISKLEKKISKLEKNNTKMTENKFKLEAKKHYNEIVQDVTDGTDQDTKVIFNQYEKMNVNSIIKI